ncbi:MAG: hypothetical protein WCH13_03035 [Deltaproteobacteria bacterium]
MISKTLLLGVWGWALGCVVGGKAMPASQIGRAMFWLMLVAHAVETLIYLPTLRAAGGSLGLQIVQTLLFGVLHLRDLAALAG